MARPHRSCVRWVECAIKEEDILASFSPLHSSFSAIPIELGKARDTCTARDRQMRVDQRPYHRGFSA